MTRGARAWRSPLPSSVVTLGTFDGVHLGHRALIDRAVEVARARHRPALGYTFDPHPAKVLAPHLAPPMLLSIEERVRLLLDAGLDHVIVEPFDAAFASVSAERFVADYLVAGLAPVQLIVGFNFSYGRGRSGTPATLMEEGRQRGFDVEVIEAQHVDGAVVSSSRIRALLEAGQVAKARALLGHPFGLTGRVIEGDRRGRLIGYPTANLAPEAELIPALGVYASCVQAIDDEGLPMGLTHAAMTNIGRRPTFAGEDIRIETHVLDYHGDLYGRRFRVSLLERLRGEQQFSSVDELRAQLARDEEMVRSLLATEPLLSWMH